MRYRVKSGYHGRWENGISVTYGPGDPIELTTEQAAAFGDKVEPDASAQPASVAAPKPSSPAPAPVVEPPPPAEAPEPEPVASAAEEAALPFAISTLPAIEAVARVRGIDDPDTLRVLLAEERAGKDRKTVVNAIESRLP